MCFETGSELVVLCVAMLEEPPFPLPLFAFPPLPLFAFPPPPLGRHSLYTLTAETPPPQAKAADGTARAVAATIAATTGRFSPPNTVDTVAGRAAAERKS